MKINELKKIGFQKTGCIVKIKPTIHKVQVGFELEPGLSTDPHVYVWVDVTDNNNIVVLYCGRAGKGIKKRMYEHSQGFKGPQKGSKSGKRKHDILLSLLKNRRNIEIWAMVTKDEKSKESTIIESLSKLKNNWLLLNSII
jgi:hypothetical protein